MSGSGIKKIFIVDEDEMFLTMLQDFLSEKEKYGVALQAVQKGTAQYVMKDEATFEKIATMISGM